MSDDVRQAPDFESVKTRLAEIADTVEDEKLSLDDALDLYEEAVALGLKASDLLEIGIDPSESPAEGNQDPGNVEGTSEGSDQPSSAENESCE